MLVGLSIDDSEYEIGTGALLEELVASFGFSPKYEVPLCLEYFDLYQTDLAYSDLIADIFYQVTKGDLHVGAGEAVLESAIHQIVDAIIMACEVCKLDRTKLQGIDIIYSDHSPRIVIWFNKEDTQWKHQV